MTTSRWCRESECLRILGEGAWKSCCGKGFVDRVQSMLFECSMREHFVEEDFNTTGSGECQRAVSFSICISSSVGACVVLFSGAVNACSR